MTGQGGWPLNVFITPEQVPFYAGTYFPPEQRQGMPCWPQVLLGVAKAWREQREDDPTRRARRWSRGCRARRCSRPSERAARRRRARRGGREAARELRLDQRRLGPLAEVPGRARRSSSSCAAGRRAWRCRRCARWPRAASTTRSAAASRATRSTRRWTVPHFEKMLYDNALLARAYLHGWQVSGDAVLRRTAEETLDWILREMTGPEGGFHSALDADSEGVEGKFYVWSLDELRAVLGDDFDVAVRWFGASEQGNFEGANILESRGAEPEPEVRERIRARLYETREAAGLAGPRRQAPDRRGTRWRSARFAEAGAVLERDDYLAAARRAADVPARDDARRRRPAAAHLQRRRGEAQRLPRGPRVPARGAARRSTRRRSSRAGFMPRARPPTR